MRHIKLWESFHKDYAEEEFDTVQISPEEEVGDLHHGTSLLAALNILQGGEISTPNSVFDQGRYTFTPWFKKEETLDPLYGDFVYTTKDRDGFYGVGECDVIFVVDGDALKKIRPIYKTIDQKIEGHLHMVEGSIPLELCSELICFDGQKKKIISSFTGIKITVETP